MVTNNLVRQRIRYLIEFGGLYPAEEPASKNFVVKVAGVLVLAQLVGMIVEVFLIRG